MGCSGGTPLPPSSPPTQSPAPPTPTSAPTEPSTATATPSLQPTETSGEEPLGFPSVGCCRGTEVEPGRYELPRWLGIPFGLDVPGGWRVINESAAGLFMLGRGAGFRGIPIELIVLLDATSGGTAEALAEGFRGVPQLTEVAQPGEVTIAGFSGTLNDMSALPNPDYEGDPEADIPPGVQFLPAIQRYFAPGFLWTTSSVEARVRTIWLAAGEQVVLLYLEAPPDSFEEFIADADAMLTSIEVITP